MKRRDFLTTAISSAGVLLPVIARSASIPCPPGSLAASGGSAIQQACVADPIADVPSWVNSPLYQWTSIPNTQLLPAMTDDSPGAVRHS